MAESAAPMAEDASAQDVVMADPLVTDTRIFRSRAEQKIMDFMELATMVSSSENDPEFHDQARTMLTELFADELLPSQLPGDLAVSDSLRYVSDLVQVLENTNREFIIPVKNPLFGELERGKTLQIALLVTDASGELIPHLLVFSYAVVRIEKQFGTTTEASWEVVLTGMVPTNALL